MAPFWQQKTTTTQPPAAREWYDYPGRILAWYQPLGIQAGGRADGHRWALVRYVTFGDLPCGVHVIWNPHLTSLFSNLI